MPGDRNYGPSNSNSDDDDSNEEEEVPVPSPPSTRMAKSTTTPLKNKVTTTRSGSSTKRTLEQELGGRKILVGRESAAYGSQTAGTPMKIKRTFEGENFTEKLVNIFGSKTVPFAQSEVGGQVNRPKGRSGTRASKAGTTATQPVLSSRLPAPEKAAPQAVLAPNGGNSTFGDASGAVKDAAVNNNTQGTPTPASRRTPVQPRLAALPPVQQQALQNLPKAAEPEVAQPAPKPVQQPAQNAQPAPPRQKNPPSRRKFGSDTGSTSAAEVEELPIRAGRKLRRIYNWFLRKIGLLSLLMLLFFLLGVLSATDNAVSRNASHTVERVTNTIRHHTPHFFLHPLSKLNDASIHDLNKRVSRLEVDVAEIKIDIKDQKAALTRISEKLPDFVVFKKNKGGKADIPVDFWHALKGKIQEDKGVLGADGKGKTGLADFDEFIRSNDERLKKMVTDEVKVSRQELQEMIEKESTTAKTYSAEQVDKLRKKVEANLKKSEHMSKSETQTRIEETTSRILGGSKIEAFINNKIQEANRKGLRQYNHFAPNLGAMIMKQHTSPNFIPDHYNSNIAVKAVLWTTRKPLPPLLPPAAALKKWDEAGECWCAVLKDYGAQLHVETKNVIYPTEVVVEHINKEETYDLGSAPKDMELFVKIPLDQQDEIASGSEGLFRNTQPEKELGHEWIKVAKWTYDINAGSNTQVFSVQLNLKRYGVGTKEFVVRARTVYGGIANHACFYRVRLHGELEAPLPELPFEESK